ncbi:MAG: prepilin-type N-terminal cleavage/methylation domain-containing protein, partial [Elusimicrobia bacterium]|nr:prepilin-type N-terminal cleavage/methylation domain-containing protein [Elusimicrobiota bacterium]
MAFTKGIHSKKGFTLPELMITVAILGIFLVVASTILLNVVRFWKVQLARSRVQQNARSALDLISRDLRQATATTVLVSQRPNQPPYSWLTFQISKGTGTAVGYYGFFQEGKNLNYMKGGSTNTVADNLKYVAFT